MVEESYIVYVNHKNPKSHHISAFEYLCEDCYKGQKGFKKKVWEGNPEEPDKENLDIECGKCGKVLSTSTEE